MMISFDYFFSNKRQYIDLIKDILALDMPDIELAEGNKSTAFMTTVFDDDKYIIQINYDTIPDARTMIAGLTHEMRHVYQMECIKQKSYDLESEQMIGLWSNALAQYADSSVKDYDLNLLELDANAFTKWIMHIIFNNDTFTVRVQDTSMFKEVYGYIQECFPACDIEECLRFMES